MILSVINHTEIPDADVQAAIRAINRQIAGDFAPCWSLSSTLRLEGKSGHKPETGHPRDMRGDGVIYLWSRRDAHAALGFHNTNNRGIPFGFVFTELAKKLGEPWTTSLSHEALEMTADPECNLLVRGPHPSQPKQYVFHFYEMCDAVQGESYTIDGVFVSNFLLPLYFTGQDEMGGRNDFLSTPYREPKTRKVRTLRSFGINPGGFIGYFNPATGKHEVATLGRDAKAQKRLQLKRSFGAGRRSMRYLRFTSAGEKPASRGAASTAEMERPTFVPVPEGVQIVPSKKR